MDFFYRAEGLLPRISALTMGWALLHPSPIKTIACRCRHRSVLSGRSSTEMLLDVKALSDWQPKLNWTLLITEGLTLWFRGCPISESGGQQSWALSIILLFKRLLFRGGSNKPSSLRLVWCAHFQSQRAYYRNVLGRGRIFSAFVQTWKYWALTEAEEVWA